MPATAASAVDEPRRRLRPSYVYPAAGLAPARSLPCSHSSDFGEHAGRLGDWQAFTLRRHAGPDRAAADLVLGQPDPRPVDRELAVPREPPGLQQDLRRRAAPGHRSSRSSSTSGTTSCVTSRPGSSPCAAEASRTRTSRSRGGSPRPRSRPRSPAAAREQDTNVETPRSASRIRSRSSWRPSLRCLLWVADRSPQDRAIGKLGFWTARRDRISQILALMPGFSRSGITIATGASPASTVTRRALRLPAR